MPVYLSLCYLVLALVGTGSTLISPEGIGIIKALPTLFLTACAWAYTRPRFGPWLVIAALTGPWATSALPARNVRLMAGIVTFLIGHMPIPWLLPGPEKYTGRILLIVATLFVMNVLAVLVSIRMLFVGEQGLIFPVFVYVAVMGVMMILTVLHQSPTRFIAAEDLSLFCPMRILP